MNQADRAAWTAHIQEWDERFRKLKDGYTNPTERKAVARAVEAFMKAVGELLPFMDFDVILEGFKFTLEQLRAEILMDKAHGKYQPPDIGEQLSQLFGSGEVTNVGTGMSALDALDPAKKKLLN